MRRRVAIARNLAKGTPAPGSQVEKAAPAQMAAAKPAAKAPAKTAQAKAAKASTPAVAAKATPAPVASGAWRIQLGAFSQKGSAEALYGKLSGKAALSGRHAFYIPVGAITRLQVGPFESKAAAQSACNAVGVACFPVAAK